MRDVHHGLRFALKILRIQNDEIGRLAAPIDNIAHQPAFIF